MKLIKPSYSILEQNSGLEGIYEQIELAGRTCYKSTPKIEEFANLDITSLPEGMSIDELPVFKEHPEEFKQRAKELNLKVDYFKVNTSAKDFVDRMIASQHYAMLEHGTVYLAISHNPFSSIGDSTFRYRDNPYSKVINALPTKPSITYITTNYRVLVENGWLDDLKYLCEPTEHHEKRVTVRFTTDRGVSHEFVRHRVFSFAQESTRYCNYSKDKFGGEITFIIPSWINAEEGNVDTDSFGRPINPKEETYDFLSGLGASERSYFRLLNRGCTPQQARQVLPNALKTELVMTGFTSDWRHFFDLRALGTTGAPHPDTKALALPLMEEFETKHLL